MSINYLETAKHYLNSCTEHKPITVEIADKALLTTKQFFPPKDAREAFYLLIALNLLNAFIKTPKGRHFVSYFYIKGMAGMLYDMLDQCPIRGVQTFHDKKEHITYFRVNGLQISFHYAKIPSHKPHRRHLRQTWDGLRLQQIAVELFLLATADLPRWLPPRTQSPLVVLVDELLNTPPAFRENRQESLLTSLTMNPWTLHRMTLYRRKDNLQTRIIRYNGKNYIEVMTFLAGKYHRIPRCSPTTMMPNYYYYISPQMRIRSLPPSRYLTMLARNNYLLRGRLYRNMLVTYGIARYLALMFPGLSFLCTLNANRHKVRTRRYQYRQLCAVPLRSQSRLLKVWLPYDPQGVLADFKMHMLPKFLVQDYLETEDYYQEFEIISHKGFKGLYAYRRHHLLKSIYADIKIHHYYAHVQEVGSGKWAIYSLSRERFETNFVYDRLWYDTGQYIIYGCINSRIVVVYDFFGKITKR
jgi:hypothetical protein